MCIYTLHHYALIVHQTFKFIAYNVQMTGEQAAHTTNIDKSAVSCIILTCIIMMNDECS